MLDNLLLVKPKVPTTPQVRPKMNDKKPSKFQYLILLLRGARSFFDAKKMKKTNFASLDFGNNPIYPISNSDGQDREV